MWIYGDGRRAAEVCAASSEYSGRDFRPFDQGLDVPGHEVCLRELICRVSVNQPLLRFPFFRDSLA